MKIFGSPQIKGVTLPTETRCADFDKAHNTARDSQHPIDRFHQKFKQDWWDERERLECLIDFSVDDGAECPKDIQIQQSE